MPRSKRSRSRDPSHPSKRIRTRCSPRLQGLPPTPDDALSAADLRSAADSRSIADSAAPSTSHAEEKVPAGPANPGVVRNRDDGVLSRLPLDSDVLDAFAQLRRDFNLSDEQAFMKLITAYDISMAALCRISSYVYPTLLHRNLFA